MTIKNENVKMLESVLADIRYGDYYTAIKNIKKVICSLEEIDEKRKSQSIMFNGVCEA